MCGCSVPLKCSVLTLDGLAKDHESLVVLLNLHNFD